MLRSNYNSVFLYLLLVLICNGQLGFAQSISVSAAVQANRFGVYEIDITHDESSYNNVWWDVSLNVVFTSPTGQAVTVDGFYYDTDTWKVRFAPSELGNYTWLLDFMGQSASGMFTSNDIGNKGFIIQHPGNNHRWLYSSTGELFNAIGSQSYTTNHFEHQKINLSQDWDVGGFQMEQIQDRVSLEDYLTVMIDESGHNLWRWGSGNMGYYLWDQISDSGNVYNKINGQYTDRYFQAIRQHGGRVYFDIIGGGINDPTGTQFRLGTPQEQIASEHYVRYVVARYGAFVDFWQTSNEQALSDNLIAFLSTKLKQYDPYNHLVSASWRRPDHNDVDINAPHWYSTFDPANAAGPTAQAIASFKSENINKPVMIDEIGEAIRNCNDPLYAPVWSATSSNSTRMKYWAALFNEAILFSWDQSKSKEVSGGNYYDPELKRSIRALNSFGSQIEADVVVDTGFNSNGVSGGTHTGAIGFGLRSSQSFYAFISDATENLATDVQLSVDVPVAGQAVWYEPSTGRSIGSIFAVNSGTQILSAPTFQYDLALMIKGGNSLDTPPNAIAGNDVIIDDLDNDGLASVSLDASSSFDTDGGSIQSWVWRVYGHTIGIGAQLQYQFKQGITPVTLSVTDDEGNISTDFLRVRVSNSQGLTPPFLSLKHNLTGDWGHAGSVNLAMFAVSEDIDVMGINHFTNNNYTWLIDGTFAGSGAQFWSCGNNNNQYSGLNRTADISVGLGGHVVTVIADTGQVSTEDSELYIAYEPDVGNVDPTADAGPDFSVQSMNGNGWANVSLTGSGTDSDGSITGYFWYDGKDFLGRGQNFVAEFGLGEHQVTLVAVDNQGGYGDDRVVVTVTQGNANIPPVADAGEDIIVTDTDGSGDELVLLDGSASFDPDGTITSWSWSNVIIPIATGEMRTINLSVGVYDLLLTVTDDQGATDTDQIRITVLSSDSVFIDGFE